MSTSSMPGSDSICMAEDWYWLKTSWIIRSNGRDDAEQFDCSSCFYSQRVLHWDTCRSDVQRVHWLVRKPASIKLDELDDTIKKFFAAESGKSQVLKWIVESIHVVDSSENVQIFSIFMRVRLHTFEAFKRVVKSWVSRINLERMNCVNDGLLPSILLVPIYLKHVISEQLSKHILMVRAWLILELCTVYDHQIFSLERGSTSCSS